MRVPYQELCDVLERALTNTGLDPIRARQCARLVADSSRDGVASHGLNLFPRLLTMIRAGIVNVDARPARVSSLGALERWDGHRGVGALNAHECMAAAVALSRAQGVGCIALANTNHWMRGGTYGWQAAEAGVIALCWTNTMANLPAWGAPTPRLGNNPLVIAVPRAGSGGAHVVLDMAMSQFSYGALASYRMRGEPLPVPGGFDEGGGLTSDPAAIEASKRPLPIGFWKGSGLSLMLDMMASLLSGGWATHQVPAHPEQETGLSQVFIAIDVSHLAPPAAASGTVDAILADLQARYPGQRTLETRRQNMEQGIPVEPSIFEQVCSL